MTEPDHTLERDPATEADAVQHASDVATPLTRQDPDTSSEAAREAGHEIGQEAGQEGGHVPDGAPPAEAVTEPGPRVQAEGMQAPPVGEQEPVDPGFADDAAVVDEHPDDDRVHDPGTVATGRAQRVAGEATPAATAGPSPAEQAADEQGPAEQAADEQGPAEQAADEQGPAEQAADGSGEADLVTDEQLASRQVDVESLDTDRPSPDAPADAPAVDGTAPSGDEVTPEAPEVPSARSDAGPPADVHPEPGVAVVQEVDLEERTGDSAAEAVAPDDSHAPDAPDDSHAPDAPDDSHAPDDPDDSDDSDSVPDVDVEADQSLSASPTASPPVTPAPVTPAPVTPPPWVGTTPDRPHARHRATPADARAAAPSHRHAGPAGPTAPSGQTGSAAIPDARGATPVADSSARAGAGRRTRLTRALSPRRTRGQLLAAVLCAVLGFAMVAQARQTNADGLASLRQSDLVEILAGLNEQSTRLENEIRDLQQTRDELKSGSDSGAAAQEAAKERLDVLGILTGTVPAAGPGIELSISDPDRRVSADELLNAVQELRGAGAEAIQIGDVRVVAQTPLIEGDDGVVIDGHELLPPYRVRAVGDPQALSTALNIPGGVLEVLHNDGATGTVRRLDEVTIDALRALDDAEFARPAPTKD